MGTRLGARDGAFGARQLGPAALVRRTSAKRRPGKPVYNMVRDSPEARAAAVNILVDTYFLTPTRPNCSPSSDCPITRGTSPAEARSPHSRRCVQASLRTGRRLLARPRHYAGRANLHSSHPLGDARQAVLLRSQGRCENPRCTGDIQDRTDRGEPILEVDHIQDLAQGGPDQPAQMIALCPNCHAIKTRGRTSEEPQEGPSRSREAAITCSA